MKQRKNSDAFYKEVEDEINKHIHTKTNSRTFIKAFGIALDVHLSAIENLKVITSDVLDSYNLPNKDAYISLALRIIECEEKIDILENKCYEQNVLVMQTNYKLLAWENALSELKELLIYETTQIRENKLTQIESELKDLQLLFRRDLNDDL
ncbi:hypothetical protein EJF36_11870 [Bacillus sp. HMF5848]|uniref:hypothetical protein n=1 Tax=Bacillus sp. HMF5848 TaxID=2495421 RepID=UPI000F7992B5|nr:hypothetical protein [Bacillus sp. HMF5848]RSK27521.1 hypothetical protein EJF36_11870 [Bacillus sp. HMF5848]